MTFRASQTGNVYAKGNISCDGNLTALNIYTKAQTEDLLATKATIAYVDDQLLLKANQATTYSKTETEHLLTPKAAVAYVDGQLLLKVNTTDMTAALALKS